MLQGIVILDFSHYLPGPFATMRLADLGAEVIKVEPLHGDLARGFNSESRALFDANNRSKKSVAINVKHPEGKELALRLIEKADVVLESFRPGVMNKLGLGYEEACKVNPGIIYASLTGYGQNGEFAKFASHDLNFMAVSGVLSQLKDKKGAPIHPKLTFGDEIGGMHASERILAALLQKGRTGRGCYLDISLTDSLIMLMNTHVMLEKQLGKQYGLNALGGNIVSYCIYPTKDNRFVALGAVESKFWTRFCEAAARPDWIQKQYDRACEGESVYEEVKALFAGQSLAFWCQFAKEVDCCLTPVLETEELSESAYTQHILTTDGYVLAHPEGEVSPPPQLGEHSYEIFEKQLGLSKQEIANLQNEDIIGGITK
ncbi:CoA transferase [Bacillus sp. 165]|nr:CoA transferase [Bacillus sp. 165]